MSTVRLKQTYEGRPKGELISVPFGKGRELVKVGIAEYPAAPKPAEPAAEPGAPTVPQAEYDALAKRAKELEAANQKLTAQVAELTAANQELTAAAKKKP